MDKCIMSSIFSDSQCRWNCCWVSSQEDHTHARMHARTHTCTHTHMHTRTRTHARAHTHAHTHTRTHTRLKAPFPGLPGWAGTRKVKPIWILLKQETVSGNSISWAICKSASRSRQITMPVPHHSSLLQAGCPSCHPTNSIKALKANKPTRSADCNSNK